MRFESTGVILSPGYPESYPNLQMCSWLINVEKGYNITLHFGLFQTEKEFDILEIFDGTQLSKYAAQLIMPLTKQFCYYIFIKTVKTFWSIIINTITFQFKCVYYKHCVCVFECVYVC